MNDSTPDPAIQNDATPEPPEGRGETLREAIDSLPEGNG